MEQATFSEIYEAHAADVHRFVRYLSGSQDLADEVTAETFMRAWTGRAPVRTATARAYLLAIARNLVTDERRRTSRLTAITDVHPARSASAQDLLEYGEVMEELRAMPRDYSEPLLLSAGGLAYDEIAAMLGLSVATVKIRIFRARTRLKELHQ